MRVDDYKNACLIALDEIMAKDPKALATAAGALFDEGGRFFQLNFFGRPARVFLKEKPAPEEIVRWADQKEGEEFSLTDAVLVLHYLLGAKGLPPTGDLVAYRQMPGGEFYTQAFHRRAEEPLAKVFGSRQGLLTQAMERMGGELVKGFGDEAGKFRVLPHIDIMVQIYYGDEEFEASGQVLFDRVIASYLSMEDVSWLGSALVYRLMGLARGL